MRFAIRSKFTAFVLVLGALLLAIPVPYVRLTPGPVFNTLGEIDGKKLVEISGTQTYPTSGELNLTTVSEYGGPTTGLNVFEAIIGWVRTDQKVIPREALYPENVDPELARAANAEAFATSQSYAIGVALNYLDQPVAAYPVIAAITADAPAHEKLRAGDRIISVNGVQTATPKLVVEQVRATAIGAPVDFVVLRDGIETKVSVVTAAKPDEADVSYVGAAIDTFFEAPFEISFAATNIGGPSAGLMFTLALIDELTPGELTGAHNIAGTGTIDPDGKVGPIGGIAQKMIGAKRDGAELFLAPAQNCADALKAIPAGLVVTPVSNIDEAMKAVETFVAGGQLPVCQP